MAVVPILLAVVVVGTSTWVGVDAHALGVATLKDRKDLPGSVRTPALTWAIAVLLFWIVFFPWYLARRSTIKAAVANLVRDPRFSWRQSSNGKWEYQAVDGTWCPEETLPYETMSHTAGKVSTNQTRQVRQTDDGRWQVLGVDGYWYFEDDDEDTSPPSQSSQ